MDVHREPFLDKVIKEYPVRSCSGYPILQQNLKLHDDLVMYFILDWRLDKFDSGARQAAFILRQHFET